jgi:hypothetical protein
MTDRFTETTNRSWFSRMRSSVGGILFGFILLFAAIVLLFWNEGRAVKTAKALAEGASAVISVDAATPDPANDGKLVHISGPLVPKGEPRDSEFAISAPGAIRLERQVEMYQWKETSRSETRVKLGGGEETVTVYEYSKEWASGPVNSSSFRIREGHENPPFPLDSQDFRIDSAAIGGFRLTGDQIGGMGSSNAVPADAAAAQRLSAMIGRPARMQGGVILTGFPSSPQIGDLRVSWRAARVDSASVVGAQQGDALAAYTTSNGRKLFLTRATVVPAAQMFEEEQQANTMVTWLVRAGGLLALYIAYSMILGVIGVIGDVIPPLGRLLRAGTGIFAFAMMALTGALAIAAGWLFFRPLLSLAIVATGFAIAWAAGRMGRRPAAAPEPA